MYSERPRSGEWAGLGRGWLLLQVPVWAQQMVCRTAPHATAHQRGWPAMTRSRPDQVALPKAFMARPGDPRTDPRPGGSRHTMPSRDGVSATLETEAASGFTVSSSNEVPAGRSQIHKLNLTLERTLQCVQNTASLNALHTSRQEPSQPEIPCPAASRPETQSLSKPWQCRLPVLS